ncbi:hypothetical protein [uncultured Ruminococcus sp.]|uniref:hypothetical protein n=1 Tax=uncultured Ruminococcus sp. TaxID=165186 RepID=UPI00263320B4|nr:hypothetical protein [uncultured Ruminococcus sp.]
MLDDIVHRQYLKILVMCIIAASAIAAMLLTAYVSKAAFIAAAAITAVAVLWALTSLIYILRLRKFAAGLPELPEHYFRKSSYRIEGKFYWFSDHFLDLRKLRKIPYEKISSITVYAGEYGVGSVKTGPFGRPLLPLGGANFLTVRYGFRSVRITLGDNEKKLRTVLKHFTKHNENIRVYDIRNSLP